MRKSGPEAGAGLGPDLEAGAGARPEPAASLGADSPGVAAGTWESGCSGRGSRGTVLREAASRGTAPPGTAAPGTALREAAARGTALRGTAAPGTAPRVRLDRRAPAPAEAPVLDAQQQAVVEHRDGHLLVLAGPGTGKTTTLAELVVRRIGTGEGQLDAGSVLALTFGRRAARELSERISRRLGGGPVPTVSTFHSFAYGVLRQHADPVAYLTPPRLLTAAEQDARLRELLTHSVLEGRLEWPAELSRAVGTRGIAEQVRALLARARGQGLDPAGLARIGRQGGVPAWAAVGRFFQEYLDTLGFEGALDYAELIHQAVALASKEREGRALREAYRLIVVDEYQDTDPSQVRLLVELARGGAQVVAVGDPDQAIYGFRGADVGGILEFAERFRDPVSGAPARIEVLRTTRRFPQPIAEAAQRVLGPAPLTGLPVDVQRLHRSPRTQPGPAEVMARTYPSTLAEAAGVAETLLRARAGLDGHRPLDWSQMAVLVRNPAVQAPSLARALRTAGIPVLVPPDDLALADEPAVQVLSTVVGLAIDPGAMPHDTGRMLLTGPLGRVDPVSVRGLARAVLVEHRAGQALPPGGDPSSGPVEDVPTGPDPTGPGRMGPDPTGPDPMGPDPMGPDPAGELGDPGSSASSDALLTRALAEGSLPDSRTVPVGARAGFARVARAVGAVRSAVARDEVVSEVLWAAWASTDWPDRLREAALRGGPGGLAAHRDLDAVVSLFDLANRLPAQRRGTVGVTAFLADVRALRLPPGSAGEGEALGDAVRLLSAHRAKGLEWELVVVAAVQEGQWPDLRLRSDLLQVEELDRAGRRARRTHADLLAEERRLMYVACTRARSRLVVTAVAEPVDGGLQHSRFLADLGVPIEHAAGRSRAPLAGPGLVTTLRAAAGAPQSLRADGTPDPAVEALRGAAIQRLAALARRFAAAGGGGLGGIGGPVAAADPRRWWGVRPVTGHPPLESSGDDGDAGDAGDPPGADTPAAATPSAAGSDAPGRRDSTSVDPASTGRDGADLPEIRLSPSSVEALRTCPLRWFLERRVGAETRGGSAAAVGVVVHAVAEALARGEVDPDPLAIAPFVDEVWARMPFAARYESDRARARVDEMIRALLAWQGSTGRVAHAVEVPFSVPVPGLGTPVRVAGKIDRIDRAPDGTLHVVDFKTGRTAISARACGEHPQLGVYQLALREGALADPDDPEGSGVGPDDQQAPATSSFGPIVGGAELVHLGDRYATGMPKVRLQAPLGEGWTWVHDLVGDAARLAAGPSYPARRNDRCGTCAFRYMCPAMAPGRAP